MRKIICQLACVGTFVEAIGQGCVRFGRFDRYTIGTLSSGSGSKGDDGLGDVAAGKLSCPAVVDDHDSPKAILGVAPPLQDSFAIEGDFATGFVKKYFAARVAQDGGGEEIVGKA
jgi:hypothetical protein